MALLPQKVGSVTLMRALGNDGVTESYVGILDQPAGKQVIVRKVLTGLARDDGRLADLRERVGDLLPIRHGSLLPVLECFDAGGETFIVEEWVDSVTLAEVVKWCAKRGESIPHNVFLHLAVQICNGLEALHSRPGAASGTRNVLHLCVRPESVALTRDGDILVCNYGLVRSPTLAPHTGGIRLKTAYLSPEQTHQDQKLTPASDLFSLGAVLYEVLTHRAMFQDGTPLRTIARVRRAEVTRELLEVKEILPGLDRVLYRALALNNRHRYQRAFVLREDLRGLMAGYSFSNIEGECRAFLEPMFQGRTRAIDEVMPPLAHANETTVSLLEDTLTGVRLLDSRPRPQVPDGDSDAHSAIDGFPMQGMFDIPPDGDTGPTGTFESPLQRVTTERPKIDRPRTYTHEEELSGARTGPFSRRSADADTFTRRSADAVPLTGTSGSLARDAELQNAGPDMQTDDNSLPGAARASLSSRVPGPFGLVAESSEELDVLPRVPEDLDDATVPSRSAPELEIPVRSPTPVEDVEDHEEPGSTAVPILAGAMGLGMGVLLVFLCAGGALVGAVGMNQLNGDDATVAEAGVEPAVRLAVAPTPPAPPQVAAASVSPTAPRAAPPTAAPPPDRPRVAAVRESPTATRPAAAPRPQPVPRPTAPVVAAAMKTGDPTLRDADWDVDMLLAEDLSPLTLAPAPAPAPPPVAVAPSVAADRGAETARPSPRQVDPTLVASARPMGFAPAEDLGTLATAAYGGQLERTDQGSLASIPPSDAKFTRSRVLLYQDAKARGDHAARTRWMQELMILESNRYRPELLVEQAALAMADGDWSAALELADRAEQHWSRLPRALIVSRKSMIHEIQGNASYALYVSEDPPTEARLDGAIDAWTRYRTHALGAGREDMLGKAEARLTELRDVRRRMH